MKRDTAANPISTSVARFTSLDDLPAVLSMREYCAFTRISLHTVRKQVQRGACEVPPAFVSPYRWKKTDLVKHYQTSTISSARRRKAKQEAA